MVISLSGRVFKENIFERVSHQYNTPNRVALLEI